MIGWIFSKIKKQFHKLNKQKLSARFAIRNLQITLAQQQYQSLLNEIRVSHPERLDLFGYKVYSQNDEDGIIQEIFRRIGTTNHVFIEIGIGDGFENNTYFLLFKGWNGVWIEGSKSNTKKIRKNFAKLLESKRLLLIEQYVDKDNINSLKMIDKEIDLFSIDIDGNDLYVLEAILQVLDPRVIVAEYNSKFPPDVDWCMEYNPQHRWNGTDNFGVSLKTLTEMLQKKGYALVGTNIIGGNAFYVKKELTQNLFPFADDLATLYHPARYHIQSAFVVGHPATI